MVKQNIIWNRLLNVMATDNMDLQLPKSHPKLQFVNSENYVVWGVVVVPKDHINHGFPSEMSRDHTFLRKYVCTINLYLKIITLRKNQLYRFEESIIYFYDTISQELNPSWKTFAKLFAQ